MENTRQEKIAKQIQRDIAEIFQRDIAESLRGVLVTVTAVRVSPDLGYAKIYVSVRTRITANGETLHPSKIRLMRRMVRDRLFRKRTLSDTLMMFRSVEEGENKYIMPYKYRSTYDVDTFMAYEICAYRDFLLEDLRSMSDEPELNDASAFLADAKALSLDVLPDTSLIREFVGH